jgi:hypothetical protein
VWAQKLEHPPKFWRGIDTWASIQRVSHDSSLLERQPPARIQTAS